MKPLLVLLRIVLVGCLWSVIFTEGIRVIMLESWRFDIFWPLHWAYAWNLWAAGWVIDTPKEWAFILIIVSFIPLWLTGWIALSMISWESMVLKILTFPFAFLKGNAVTLKPAISKTPVVVKKKSYKEIRPTGRRLPIREYSDSETPKSVSQQSVQSSVSTPYGRSSLTTSSAYGSGSVKEKAATARETFSHSLFNLDNEDDDFDLDFDAFEKSDIFKIDNGKKKKEKSRDNQSFENTDNDDKNFSNSKKSKKHFEDDYNEDRGDIDDEPRPLFVSQDKDGRKSKKEYKSETENTKSSRREEKVGRKDGRKNTYEHSDKVADEQKTSRGSNPIVDVLKQKGYDIISGVTLNKNIMIDFLGIAEGKICLCLVDKEAGDWLADEERFNNEEPLWFSENSHRISPVRKVMLAKESLLRKLEDIDFDFDVVPYVIIQMGNIINAEDMFEIWDNLQVEVTRINRGSPREIKLFSKTVEEVDSKLSVGEFERIKKLLRGNM